MNRLAASVFCTVVLGWLANAAGSAFSWPNFMGPNRDHISTEEGLQVWSGDGPTVVWQAQVGIGYAGISVADGKAYTIGWADGKETIFCFDVADGKALWTHSYAADAIARYHLGGPNAAPTVHGDRVYTLSKDGQLFCLAAATGKVDWQQSLLLPLGRQEPPRWGFSASPLIDGDRVLLQGDATVAYDRLSGKLLWQGPLHDKESYSTPTLFTHGGRKLFAALMGDGLWIQDAADGTVITTFAYKVEHHMHAMTPLVTDNGSQLLISAGNPPARCIKLTFDGKTLSKQWENQELGIFMNNPILVDGYLYGVDGKHKQPEKTRFVCMDYQTGAVAWAHVGLGCGSAIYADGKLIILAEDGRLVLAEATHEAYKPLATATVLSELCWTPPSLANGLLFVRNDHGKVLCLDLKP